MWVQILVPFQVEYLAATCKCLVVFSADFRPTSTYCFPPIPLTIHHDITYGLCVKYSLTHLSRSRKYRLPVYLEVTPSDSPSSFRIKYIRKYNVQCLFSINQYRRNYFFSTTVFNFRGSLKNGHVIHWETI